MNKFQIALDSFVESLAYMMIALMVMICAKHLSDVVAWWMPLVLCVVACIVMAWVSYLGKVYGYGFDADEEEENNG